MRARSPYANRAALRQIVESARAIGIDVGGVELSPTGEVRVFDIRALTPAAQHGDLYADLKAKGLL